MPTKCLEYKYNLQTESQHPRKLTLADRKVKVDITKAVRINLDVDGRKEDLIGYVIRVL